MERPDLAALNTQQVKYLTYLEAKCQGASNLIAELNLMADAYAKDLAMIREGKDGAEGKNLTFMKEGKSFERTLVLIDKIDKFKSLAKATAEPVVKKTELTKVPDETEIKEPAKPRNIQDFAIKSNG